MTNKEAADILRLMPKQSNAILKAIEVLESENYYKSLAESYGDTINKLTTAISECNKRHTEPNEKGHWSRKIKVDAYDLAGVKTWGIKCQCDRCTFTTIVVEDFGYYKYCPN